MTDEFPATDGAANAVAQLVGAYGSILAPVAEAATGYRASLERDYGYSPTIAEAIAMEYHRHLLNATMQMITKSMEKS